MYIKRIRLTNIRGFEKVDLDFTEKKRGRGHQPRMRTVIIGRNGTCKTTFLRSIAIGLCDEIDAPGLLAEDVGQLVQEGKKSAEIEINLSPGENNSRSRNLKTFLGSGHGKDFLKEKKPKSLRDKVFVCGYGAGRWPGGEDKFRAYRIIDSVYPLFQYEQPLVGSEIALRRLRDFLGTDFYEKTMGRIKGALGLGLADRIELRKGGGVTISGPEIGRRIALEGWADGYRMTFGWLLDIYAWAMRAECITSTGNVKGTILLDEIEQHLHPSMQIDLLEKFSKLFPDLQIIATTHSPLVALGAEPSEVVVLKREGKKVVAYSDVRDFRWYSVEDILVDSRLFDSDVYSPGISRKLARYRELVSISKTRRTKEEERELKSLTKVLVSQQMVEMGETPIAERYWGLVKKYNL